MMQTSHFDIKKESKQLLGKLRHSLPPYKSKKYLAWVKKKFPDYEIHHILGSHLGKKNTDYLVIPLSPDVHRKIQKHYYKWIMPHLNTALLLLQDYAIEIGVETTNLESVEQIRSLLEKIKEKENET